MPPIIEVEDLTKTYGERRAVDGVTFRVEEGEIFGANDPKDRSRGWLNAIDADTGRVRWVWKAPTPLLAGVTPTAGGLVLTGDLEGRMHAFDAESGKKLASYAVGGPIGGGIITYEAERADGDRTQLIAVASGMASPIWEWSGGPAKITVLGLPREAR